jgi:secondary thiamine-phosphate synthase enzyme
MSFDLTAITWATPEMIATATLTVRTNGQGFTEITREAARFLSQAEAGEGSLLLFMRHTSASLVIQENADPDVQTDLGTALARVAPGDAGWIHVTEGPDDMPAHVKTMLTGVSRRYRSMQACSLWAPGKAFSSPSIAIDRIVAKYCCNLLARAADQEA